MKNLAAIAIVLILSLALSGCIVTKESVQETNAKIQAKYSSADSFTYTIDETTYIDGLFVSSQKYSEVIKKPDKTRTVLVSKVEPPPTAYSQFSGMQIVTPVVCNGNTSYNTITPTLVRVWSYVGWPMGASYCSEQLDAERSKWGIPMAITDTSRYEVTTSEVDWEGNAKGAIKAVVKVLLEPRPEIDELVATYWFEPNDFAILKEEINIITRVCKPRADEDTIVCQPLADEDTIVCQPLADWEGESTDCKNARVTVTRIYSDFGFNINVPDSFFIVNPADYPGVTFEEATENWRGG